MIPSVHVSKLNACTDPARAPSHFLPALSNVLLCVYHNRETLEHIFMSQNKSPDTNKYFWLLFMDVAQHFIDG